MAYKLLILVYITQYKQENAMRFLSQPLNTIDTILLPVDLAKPNPPKYKSNRPCGFGFFGRGMT